MIQYIAIHKKELIFFPIHNNITVFRVWGHTKPPSGLNRGQLLHNPYCYIRHYLMTSNGCSIQQNRIAAIKRKCFRSSNKEASDVMQVQYSSRGYITFSLVHLSTLTLAIHERVVYFQATLKANRCERCPLAQGQRKDVRLRERERERESEQSLRSILTKFAHTFLGAK